MELRKLDPMKDGRRVAALFLASADFVQLTEGTQPGPAQAAAFFKGVPPGCNIELSVKVGLFEGDTLLGIADMAFGYPGEGDAYIGLMLFAPSARGRGLGKALLALLEEEAGARGAEQMFVSVIEANAPARAFWLREGFMPVKRIGPVKVGAKAQMVDRMVKRLR
ncbi:MAG TPA: GNAT family N-acetyltransferase [Rhodobacterales bacterium]|nr:GNAT family N-acetyltransferase [Rhodobacterales bacterium]